MNNRQTFRGTMLSCLAVLALCALPAKADNSSVTAVSSGFGQNDYTGNPRFRIIDDMLHAPGSDGIMRRAKGSDSDWESFALQGYSVVNFAISGDEIMAIVIPKRDWDLITLGMDMSADARLMKCKKDGTDLRDITAPAMEDPNEPYPVTWLIDMAQHPEDPNTILAGGYNGNYISHDFGETWRQCEICPLNNPHSFLGWNPQKPGTMVIASESVFMSAYVACSTDDGMSWEFSGPDNTGDGSCHQIAFDPNDPDRLLAACSEKISESLDGGATWRFCYNGLSDPHPMIGFVYNIMFDPADPAGTTVYAVGNLPGSACRSVIRSTDSGATWKPFLRVNGHETPSHFFDAVIFDGNIWIYDKDDIVSLELPEVSAVESADASPARQTRYDLDGRKITAPAPGQIYIQGGKKKVQGR